MLTPSCPAGTPGSHNVLACRPRSPRAAGFTLIELLTVIAIVSVFLMLMLPAVQSARDAALRLKRYAPFVQLGNDVEGFADRAEAAMQALALQLEPVANGGDPSIGGLEYLEPLCTTLAEADDLKLRIERARQSAPRRVDRFLAGLERSFLDIIRGRERVRYLIRKDLPDVGCP